MICHACADAADHHAEHVGCAGHTRCDCQHQPARPRAADTIDIDIEDDTP